jgi:hypothetical protein
MGDKPKKQRRTRLKGTATEKPCVDCGQLKHRFNDFKPRWAGCATHRTDRGRRYHEPGCDECEKLVNGNIRQPRCIECDKARPKKRAAKSTPEPVAVETTPEPVLTVLPGGEPEPEVVETTPEPEPVEPEVVGLDEPSPESVKVPEPEPKPKPKRPKIATKADLLALFDSEATDGED